jgi:hypothetical protein
MIVCKCSATFSTYYDFSYNDHNHFKLLCSYSIIFIRDDIDDGKCGGTVKGIIFIRNDIDDGKCGGTVKGIIFIRDDIYPISVLFYIRFTVVVLC